MLIEDRLKEETSAISISVVRMAEATICCIVWLLVQALSYIGNVPSLGTLDAIGNACSCTGPRDSCGWWYTLLAPTIDNTTTNKYLLIHNKGRHCVQRNGDLDLAKSPIPDQSNADIYQYFSAGYEQNNLYFLSFHIRLNDLFENSKLYYVT